ncbi:MAG: S8 family serine peptidase [Aeromicrobium erythreum]
MRTTVAAACGTIVLAATVLTAPGAQADPEPQARRVAPTDVASPRPAVARGLIVKTRSGTSDATIERATQKAADAVLDEDVDVATPKPVTGRVDVVDFDQVVPGAQAAETAARVAARDDVVWAVPNRRVRAAAAPPVSVDDPGFPNQENLWDRRTAAQVRQKSFPTGGYAVKAPALWRATRGTSSTVVAVLDTGVRPEHPDLTNQLVAGYDMIGADRDINGGPLGGSPTYSTANDGGGRDADPTDPGDWTPAGYQCFPEVDPDPEQVDSSWHGTHVAGIVAAEAGNGTGVSGVAPGVKVQPVRVLGRCGGWDADILAGITWASGGTVPGVPANQTPAKVLNLSLGGYYDTAAEAQETCPAYVDAIDAAQARGATTVIAAGNELGSVSNSTPAACGTKAVVVGATSELGYRAFYSNRGRRVDVMAPGGDEVIASRGILSTVNLGRTTAGQNGYSRDGWMGTSMAAPAVAGGAALLSSLGVPASDMRQALRSSVSGFAPVDKGLRSVVLRDSSGTSYKAGNLNCRETTTHCGTGILDLAKVPANIGRPIVVGAFAVGSDLTVSRGTWQGSPAGLHVVRWFVDGQPVEGETGPSYTVRSADVGKRVTAQVAQTTTSFTGITTTTAPSLPIASDALLASAQHTSRVYGQPTTVTVTRPGLTGPVEVWRGEVRLGSAVAADGTAAVPVAGTAWTAGTNRLRAVASDGTGRGTSESFDVQVSKARPSSVRMSTSSKVSRKKKPVVNVRVVVSGVPSPTGRVRVYDGSRLVRSATLGSSSAGRARLVLPKLRKGTHRLKVKYDGSSVVSPRTSSSVKVRVY